MKAIKPTISNCRKNIMGTISFDGCFTGMRKPQDFIVYPMQDSGTMIKVQSEHRFGVINLETGKGRVSANRAQYANALWLQISYASGTSVFFELSAEELKTLRAAIGSTGGVEVGQSIVKSDNTGALAIAV